MGQYWVLVNFDKKEFVHPHVVGAGLKIGEQVCTPWGTGAAQLILTACERQMRGGGDLDLEFPGAKDVVGRWAGDRVAYIGDYAEPEDLAVENQSIAYFMTYNKEERKTIVEHWLKIAKESDNPKAKAAFFSKADRLAKAPFFKDISRKVAKVIEHELDGKFFGKGWRDWVPNGKA